MSTITKAEYLAALQSEADAAGKKNEKAAKRRRILAVVLGFGTIIMIALGVICTKKERADNFRKFSAGEIGVTFEFLNENGVCDVWNEQNLGNDINTILGGGRILSQHGVLVLPTADGNSVTINGQSSGMIPGSISYINIHDGTIYYRENATRKICSYSLESGVINTVIDTNAGELLVTNGRLYYVDHSDNNKVVSTDTAGQDKQININEPVTSFVVCGDDMIYLGADQTLYRKDSTGSTTALIPNVERFFFNGNIVAESDDTVFQFTAERQNAVLLHQSSAADMQLVGACADGVFIQESGKLFFIDHSNTTTIASDAHMLYQSVSVDKAGMIRYITLSSLKDEDLEEVPLHELKEGDQVG